MLFNLNINPIKICVLVFSLFLLSCSGKEPPKIQQDFTDQSILRIKTCFSGYSDKVENYLKGQLSSSKISQFWLCHIDLIELILDFRKKDLQGNPQLIFEKSEIKDILLKFLPETSSVLDVTVYNTAFKFKKLILGGQEETIHRNELQLLASKLRAYEKASLKLRTKIPVLAKYMISPDLVSYPEMKKAWSSIEPELKNLILELFAKKVSFTDLKNILLDFIDTEKTKNQLEAAVLALDQYINIFVGLDKKANDPAVIDNFLDLVNLYIHGTLGWQKWVNGLENDHLIKMVSKLFLSLESSLQERANQTILFHEWHLLFERVSKVLNSESETTLAALDGSWLNLTERFLQAKSGHFGIIQLAAINSAITQWQKSLNFYSLAVQHPYSCDSQSAKAMPVEGVELARYLVHCSGLNFNIEPAGRVFLGQSDPVKSILSYEAYMSINFKHVFLKPFAQVYANDENQFGINELTSWVDELIEPWKPLLGSSLDLSSFYSRTLVEADLLTLYSDGNKQLSVSELSSFIQYIISGYESAQQIKKALSPSCYKSGKIHSACLSSEFAFFKKTALINFPGLNRGLSLSEGSSFVEQSLSVVADLKQDLYISSFDLLELLILWHYSESFFHRFDTNSNNLLDYPEIVKSFQLAEGAIGEILGLIYPEVRPEDTYSFMMAKGYIPNNEPVVDPNEILVFQHWVKFPEKRTAFAKRSGLIDILATISSLFKD